ELADRLGGLQQLQELRTSRLAKLRTRCRYIRPPSESRTKRFQDQSAEVLSHVRAAVETMRAHIVTLARDNKEADDNLAFCLFALAVWLAVWLSSRRRLYVRPR